MRKDGPVRHGHRDKAHVRPIRQFFDKVLQPDACPRTGPGADAAFQRRDQRHAFFCKETDHSRLSAVERKPRKEHDAENQYQCGAERPYQ